MSSELLGKPNPSKAKAAVIVGDDVKLFVANFHSGTADDELEYLFSKYGTVDSAYVCHDFESGESRGFGFVEMPDEDDAEDAIDRLNGKWLNGKKLKVSKALR